MPAFSAKTGSSVAQKIQYGTLTRAVATIAAGAEVILTVTAGQQWRLVQLYAKLTTSATVANRMPYLQIKNGADVLWSNNLSTVVVPASKVAIFQPDVSEYTTYSANAPAGEDYFMRSPLPPVEVAGADTIETSTTSLQTGTPKDAWTEVRLAYVRVL